MSPGQDRRSSDGPAEKAQPFAQSKILPMYVGEKTGLLQVEGAFFVEQVCTNPQGNDLGDKEIVRSQFKGMT